MVEKAVDTDDEPGINYARTFDFQAERAVTLDRPRRIGSSRRVRDSLRSPPYPTGPGLYHVTQDSEANMLPARGAHLALALEGVGVVGPGRVIRYVNAAFERIYGYSRDEIIGRPPGALIPLGEADVDDDTLLGAPSQRWEGEVVRIRKDGQRFRARQTLTLIRNDAGEIVGRVVTQREVEAPERVDAELRKRNHRAAQVGDAATPGPSPQSPTSQESGLREQLLQSQKMEAVARLAGGIAHEFNNLITTITSYAGLGISATADGSRVHGFLREIEKAGARAARLTEQLLAYSSQQITQPRIVDFNDIVLSMDPLLRRLLGADVELIVNLDPNLALVRVDPRQMEHVVLNLATNSHEAMPHGGRFTIETSNVGGGDATDGHSDFSASRRMMLTVSDTGTGMSPEVRNRAFEPFFTTKQVGDGTGLGLSTCYSIVTHSGGSIAVESKQGVGTTFKVWFPEVELLEEPLAPAEEVRPQDEGGETVLLVDDEPQVLEVTSHLLRGQGYRVIEASNGHEALLLGQEQGIELDLLLTDIVMPLMGGKELADRLTQMHPRTKVHTDDAIVQDGVLDPGTEFMQKPFTRAILARRVREVLDKQPLPD